MEEIFGGAKNADVYADVKLTITNGSHFKRVFGGNNTSGAIAGTITVEIKESGCEPIIIEELYAGGYLAVGTDGNIKNYGARESFSSYENGYFNRFDGGLKLGCGVGFNMLYADISYDIGLANIGQDSFDDTHNGCFTINLGVNF
jgi:hypothetical protein